MKIPEYIEDLKRCHMQPDAPDQPSFADTMVADTDIWSNAACRGYCTAAADHAGLTEDQRDKLVRALEWAFDRYTVSEAETLE